MIDARKLKDKATEAFAKGKFPKAAELYEQVCASDPKDLQARLRMGDAFARSGNSDKAIKAYQSAAETFAKDGFLPRAIAASKLILELDPSHTGVQQMLAELYARRNTPAPGERKREVQAPTLRHPGQNPHAIELPADETPMVLESNTAGGGDPRTPATFGKAPSAPEPDTDSDEEGIALDVEAAPAPELPATAASGVVDLSDELPPELAADMAAPAPAASARSAPAPAMEVAPAASAPPPAALAEPEVEIDIDLAEPAQAPVAAAPAAPPPAAPPPAAPPPAARAPSAPASSAAMASVAGPSAPAAPPGLRPKRASGSPPATPQAAAPAAVPPGLTAVSRAPAPAPSSAATGSSFRFDELDFDMAPVRASAQVLSFQQLGAQGDSLLHAVEAAALAGLGDESPPASSGQEETAFTSEDLAEPLSPNALPKSRSFPICRPTPSSSCSSAARSAASPATRPSSSRAPRAARSSSSARARCAWCARRTTRARIWPSCRKAPSSGRWRCSRTRRAPPRW